MKKIIQMLFIVSISVVNLFAGTNPHDSLLFDGANVNMIPADGKDCYIRAGFTYGNVVGKVRKLEIGEICGVKDTVEKIVEKFVQNGDILEEGSVIECGEDAVIDIWVYVAGDKNNGDPSFILSLHEGAKMTLPYVSSLCQRIQPPQSPPQEVLILKSVITIDAPPDAGVKVISKGKRSSVKHTKTRYSHEVKITESDTVDIIRVYNGSVEVSSLSIEVSNEDDIAKQLVKLAEDMQNGKITAEEMGRKVEEYTNYGKKINELAAPLEVMEGFKCTITKNSRTVEPLGSGDEDHKIEK